ncbi:hypothetical protein OAC89_05110 [Deltaproteobacteria bacterium]|nr:hypothetical protein [Deltaproteobacteria bacterium]
MKRKLSGIVRLENEGWTERFVASEPRLSEASDIYRDSGFDVHLEPLPKGIECKDCTGDDKEGECRVCFDGFEDQYMIIFTRPAKKRSETDDDLF